MLQRRADLMATIARLRWAAVLLSLVMLKLTDPSPKLPQLLLGLTILMAAYNWVLMFSRRIAPGTLRGLAVASLAADFAICTTWIALTANDPYASNYVVYMIVAAEAAVLFGWRGMIWFSSAFLVAFGLVYAERAEVFHFDNSIGSMVFRSAIVVVMAMVAAGLSSAAERMRADVEAVAAAAIDESRRLETVRRIALAVGSSLRRGEVLDAAVGTLRDVFPDSFCAVLLDDGSGMLRVAAGYGGPLDIAIPLPADPTLYSISETLVFEDFWNSPYLELLGVNPPEAMRGYSTAAVVPLHAEDRLLGALVALDRAERSFGAADIKVLEAVGPQVSAALENARLYEEMETLSLVDPLTRLGNRRAFDQRLAQELERAARGGTSVSLALLDVDLFKLFNDAHGHVAGDDILRRLGAALSDRLVRLTDIAFRYAGEEFAVLMPNTTAEQAEVVVQRVHEVLGSEPLPRGHSQPGGHLTISAGISACGGTGCSPGDLVEQADLALYAAKQAGRDKSVVFNSQLAATLTNWTRILPIVIEDRALHAVYQPIVRLDQRTVVAYEALARPDGRDAAISVEGMFEAAQRLGSLPDLDWLCFRAGIQDAGDLPHGMDLFVNITLAALLDTSRDPEYLDLVLRWARRAATDIVLEISEREAIKRHPTPGRDS